jgi:UDP-N-acetylmuramoyl-L-alanyl-D-glutamate--2,6-diaminopimelate ligase
VRLGALLEAAELDAAKIVANDRVVDGRVVTDAVVDDPVVTDLVIATGEVRLGAMFGCVPGSRADGHDYALDAVQRGAVALLSERPVGSAVPEVIVPSVRQALGPVSAALWGYPSRAMRVVGVTGTNGKTTTCALLAAIFEAQGWAAGVIGTLSGERTTPEAPALQRRLAEMRDLGKAAVTMEVSSHSLDQHRVRGTHFAAAIFTNLSQDHLDYHGTMDAYFEAKARLFTNCDVSVAVVNREDPWGARLVGVLSGADVPLVTFAPGDATDIVLGQRSSSFSWDGGRLELQMAGWFNIANSVAAATTARELGASRDAIRSGLASVQAVRGRFEEVDEGQPFSVLVDFAHTPAALAAALGAARDLANKPTPSHKRGRVIVVFGAGGDRDRAKRPLMGRVASDLADVVVITSDNPRSEKPLSIIEEVALGANGVTPLIDVDRAGAISGALESAGAGDVVLIAGKGHETGQDFGSHVEQFDDVLVAREALRRLSKERVGWAGGPSRPEEPRLGRPDGQVPGGQEPGGQEDAVAK